MVNSFDNIILVEILYQSLFHLPIAPARINKNIAWCYFWLSLFNFIFIIIRINFLLRNQRKSISLFVVFRFPWQSLRSIVRLSLELSVNSNCGFYITYRVSEPFWHLRNSLGLHLMFLLIENDIFWLAFLEQSSIIF